MLRVVSGRETSSVLNVQHLVAKATRDRTPVQGFCANGIAQPFGGGIFGIGESVESGAETGFNRLRTFQQLSFGHGYFFSFRCLSSAIL